MESKNWRACFVRQDVLLFYVSEKEACKAVSRKFSGTKGEGAALVSQLDASGVKYNKKDVGANPNQFEKEKSNEKLKLSLEYHCYPIWSYDEDGSLIDNDLPEELRNDEELDNLLLDIQKKIDGLYTDTQSEFTSNGFSSDDEKKAFQSKIDKALNLLMERYGSEYEIESKYLENS